MRIAIASGKGGTGKTSVSVSLADALIGAGCSVSLIDCDVEEPNCHLFLNNLAPGKTSELNVHVPVLADPDLCTGCGRCGDACRFNALVALRTEPMFFPELCHSCGGCILACPEKALKEEARPAGIMEKHQTGKFCFIKGEMTIGEARSARLIEQILEQPDNSEYTLIDAPPGTACSFVAAVRPADYIILVTEPTPFGLHDLSLAVESLRQMGQPFGVIENRSEPGVVLIEEYCRKEGIPLELQIPLSRKAAEDYAEGRLPFRRLPEIREGLINTVRRIQGRNS